MPRGRVAKADHTIGMRRLLKLGAPGTPPCPAAPDDVAEILYTGGTTRHLRGVPITHRMLLNCAAEQLVSSNALFPPEDNVVLGSAPMFHILGQACGLGTVLTYGGTLGLMPRVNLDAMFDAAHRYRFRILIGLPALYRMILEHDHLDQYDLPSLDYCFQQL